MRPSPSTATSCLAERPPAALAGTLEDSNAVDEDELPPVVTTGGTTARRHIS